MAKKQKWSRCDICWNYCEFESQLSYVVARLIDDEGVAISCDIVATISEVKKGRAKRYLLDMFRPECRPEPWHDTGIFESQGGAFLTVERHCREQIISFLAQRIL